MRYELFTMGKTLTRFGFVAGAVLWFSTVAMTTAGGERTLLAESGLQDTAVSLSDEELTTRGEDALKKICTECHPFDDIVVLRRTPKEWKEVTAQMATKGAIATQDQFAVIRQYLTRFYGVIRVNSAPAADLVAVLGFSAKEADDVVAYREAHGKFVDLAALLKVPGVPKEKLDADPDALRFE